MLLYTILRGVTDAAHNLVGDLVRRRRAPGRINPTVLENSTHLCHLKTSGGTHPILPQRRLLLNRNRTGEGSLALVRRRRWALIWPPLPTRPSGGCSGLGLRVETPDDRWLPPEDITFSWPRLHSPNVNGGEASVDVITIIVPRKKGCCGCQFG